MDAARAHKLADRIAQIVAEMLERRVKDPRLGFVTVTDARLTNDLREATVFYTVYGSPDEQARTAAALKSATGLIRSEVGHQTGLRHTPSLSFVRDTLPEGARHMEDLVAQARAADEALAAAREGAEPAGDPDPYRVPAAAGADGNGDGQDEPGERAAGEVSGWGKRDGADPGTSRGQADGQSGAGAQGEAGQQDGQTGAGARGEAGEQAR